jgi:hypothetical protein
MFGLAPFGSKTCIGAAAGYLSQKHALYSIVNGWNKKPARLAPVRAQDRRYI